MKHTHQSIKKVVQGGTPEEPLRSEWSLCKCGTYSFVRWLS